MAKRRRSQTLLVQDRYFTKGAIVTLGAFLAVAAPLVTGGWKLIYAVNTLVNTVDKHTDLLKTEADDIKNFKGDFKTKIDEDSKQRENLRSTFLDNATKTAQGIADLNTRAVKTETAYQFLNEQVGQVVQQLKELNVTAARNNNTIGSHR